RSASAWPPGHARAISCSSSLSRQWWSRRSAAPSAWCSGWDLPACCSTSARRSSSPPARCCWPSAAPSRPVSFSVSCLPTRQPILLQWWPSVRTRYALPLAFAVLLAGCSLNTPVPQAGLQPPQQWNQAPDSSVWPQALWWTLYDAPQLSRLMAQARVGNLDLASAATRLLQADAQLRQSGAALLPSVDGGASGRRGGNSGDGNVSSGFNASLNASYEIDFWGRNRAAIEAAAANLNASRYDLEALAITTDASVARNWFQLVENQARLQLARDNLTAAEQVLAIVEARYRYGADDSLAVSQQRALVAQLRANLPALEQQTLQQRNSLALLLGQGPDFAAGALPAMTDIAVPEPGAGLPSELLNRRPDIRASEQRLLAANANLTVARAALYPSIQLTGSFGAQSSALSDLVSNPLNPW